MDAFTVAREILGGVELSAEQRAQLRAINHAFAQRLYTLRRSPDASGAAAERDSGAGSAHGVRELTEAEVAALRRTLEADLLGMLTPEQRQRLREG